MTIYLRHIKHFNVAFPVIKIDFYYLNLTDQIVHKMKHETRDYQLLSSESTKQQYNTFEYQAPRSQQSDSSSICYFYIATLIAMALNSSALYIGVTFNNDTCYETQKYISLSSWLVLSTPCFLAYQAFLLFYLTTELCCGTKIPHHHEYYVCNMGILMIGKLLLSVFKLIMFIMGIIELVYQYSTCHLTVHPVTSMVIAITVINAVYYVGILY